MKNISGYRDIKWAIIRPVEGGKIITKKDKSALGIKGIMGRYYVYFWFPADKKFEAALIDNLKKAKLSKQMKVTIITDAQFGLKSGCKPATIEGTPFYATKKQLAETFIIG